MMRKNIWNALISLGLYDESRGYCIRGSERVLVWNSNHGDCVRKVVKQTMKFPGIFKDHILIELMTRGSDLGSSSKSG